MGVGLGGVGPLDGGVGLVAVGVVDVGAGADDELGEVEFVSCFEGLEAGEGSGGQLELGLGGAVDLVLGGEFLQRFVSEMWVLTPSPAAAASLKDQVAKSFSLRSIESIQFQLSCGTITYLSGA